MKIAILGNYATQFLKKPLEKKLKESFNIIELYHAEFNSIDFEFLDPDSKLYKFSPDYIIWHESTLNLRDTFYQTPLNYRNDFANQYINRITQYLETIKLALPNVKVVFPNHQLDFNDNVFGSLSLKVSNSWNFQVQKIDFLLNQTAGTFSFLYLLKSLPTGWIEPITDYSLVVNAELHFTLNYLSWLSETINNLISVIEGKFKKCIVLDLDNTLWGGVIGDDGVDNIQIGSIGIGKAFSRFQKWLKELKNRGIILAVCSKNEESIAKAPFVNHSEMVLKLDDIAIFVANWNSKADNINHIQKILNIGFDSMVFIDDNPAEREIVRNFLPAVCVPELPPDPANYLPFLIAQNLFETATYTQNDFERTKQYQEEAKRAALSLSITNMDVFLSSLEMKAKIRFDDILDIERIAQLTQRSNQFNLRTVRYTSTDILNLVNNSEFLILSIFLEDKFGAYGLISSLIIKFVNFDEAIIDTWIMSCRVLKRGVEEMLMNYLVNHLLAQKIKVLHGEFIPTQKNDLVRDLLSNLGMTRTEDNRFYLNLKDYIPKFNHIKITDNEI
jgi:FkbH-like protein